MRTPTFNFLTKTSLIECLPVKTELFVLIYDEHLEKSYDSFITNFPHRLKVPAGEQTKDLNNLVNLTDAINQFELSFNPHFIAFGGGSICDLVGFIASIWKRGCALTLIPSTWLAVVDSSHGGKNAVNVRGVKNQIGTFYFPEQVYIVTELLKQQPPERLKEAWSEIVKIALIDSYQLYQQILEPEFNPITHIEQIIAAKIKIVRQDPFEQTGLRRVLNLGHTLGHIIETQMGQNHGIAIGYGLRFSLEWSRQRGYLKQQIILPNLPTLGELKKTMASLNQIEEFLRQDKKNDSLGLNFVFIREPGQVFTEKVGISDFLDYFNQLT